jgi:thiol-disulfide isomerase/thioredoxin
MKSKIHASKFILPTALVALLFGCSAKRPEAPAITLPASTAATVGVDSIPFPVYMSYGEFEPLLRQHNDTTYVVNFWATWCKPCVEELPFFEKLITETANPTGAANPIKVLLVSMDFPKDFQRKLVPFVAEHNLQRNVVALGDLDYDTWIGKVSQTWDGAIPFTLVYKGNHRKEKSSELANYEELKALLYSL